VARKEAEEAAARRGAAEAGAAEAAAAEEAAQRQVAERARRVASPAKGDAAASGRLLGIEVARRP